MDSPLIRIDGSAERGSLPLSFLNLLELQFLSSYRSDASLPAIRRALEFAGRELGVERPLLELEFATQGRELFLRFAELEDEMADEMAEAAFVVNASREGQVAAWPEAATAFLAALDHDEEEHAAFRWWPLGKDKPVVIDTRLNAGHPSTARTGVRTRIIAARVSRGWTDEAIGEDVTASPDEIRAAVELERAA